MSEIKIGDIVRYDGRDPTWDGIWRVLRVVGTANSTNPRWRVEAISAPKARKQEASLNGKRMTLIQRPNE